MVFTTLLLWLLLYAFVLFFYITTMRLLARKPLEKLLASIQHYPQLDSSKHEETR